MALIRIVWIQSSGNIQASKFGSAWMVLNLPIIASAAKKMASIPRSKVYFASKNWAAKTWAFAITIQDDNVQDLVGLYQFAEKNRFELATSALHNGFQFHKSNNFSVRSSTRRARDRRFDYSPTANEQHQNWFRAYLNLGLIAKVLGQDRLLPCTAATDFMFIDRGRMYMPCRCASRPAGGNLEDQGWEEIVSWYELRRKFARRYHPMHTELLDGRLGPHCHAQSAFYQTCPKWVIGLG